jgi:plastocyanin
MNKHKTNSLTATVAGAGLACLVLVFLNAFIPQAIGDTSAPVNRSRNEVTGRVRVFHVDPAETLQDASGVVVWLVPSQITNKIRLATKPPHYRMLQHNKMFEPRMLVVPAGSTVEFPNNDPWLHNVFSLSRSRQFDLGLYDGGVLKAVKFDRAGISYLFCSIHPDMMAVVVTVDSTYFGVSDKSGRVLIGNVPPGQYFLHVWRENATPQTVRASRRAIFVGDGSLSLPAISIFLPNRTSDRRDWDRER